MKKDELLLKATDIHKTYRGKTEPVQVLRGLDISIHRNDLAAIVGASGSGKSTLLHILGGLDRPDSGSIRFRDRELSSMDDETLAGFRNRNIGFVFQFHHLLPEFSALENVFMPGLIAGKSMAEIKQRAEYLLEETGLKDRIDHRPSELSGGEQQRVAVARALMNEPEIIMADEPTGNLDERNTEKLLALLMDLKQKEQSAIVLITHDHRIAHITPSVFHLQEGRLTPEKMHHT
ncbi:ABC transporter ATP-binding protein [Balneolales bacterium ANBcel1]|nr:ABC transporter ATP-binding protein [Balneolales bacterium ANBcel1]